jgi:hypothetical protein
MIQRYVSQYLCTSLLTICLAKLVHLLDYFRFVLQVEEVEDIILPPCASDCKCHNMQNVSDNITLDYLNWVVMKNFGGTDDVR